MNDKASVDRELLPAVVEDPYQTRIPADPEFPPQILGGDGIVTLRHFHMAIAMDLATRFLEVGKPLQGDREQGAPFHALEEFADMGLGGPVESRVRHVGLPIPREAVLVL